ncbi:MAG: glutamate--tRNA ligase family protein [Parcubacteria group bacterium]
MSSKIITRFPPSPTGPLQVGNVRTALFNYLFAKKNKGDFIVRAEDTDKARSKREYEESMLDSLEWLGLKRDGEFWRQSERTEIYKKYLKKLIGEGKAYVSEETEGENREVVRFKNPNSVIVFEDVVRGEVQFDTTELGDFIIAKNIEEPLYHLAVVVDDFETGITHVIRGEDHISNTPRQILIEEAIGAPRPIYVHMPLILASDRSKLSKRKHGESVSLDYYRQKGYLPEAIINYLALLGWNPGTEQEIFTMEELIEQFDLAKIQKGGAIFDEKKLEWVNREHLKRLPPEMQMALKIKEVQAEPYISSAPELERAKIGWKDTSPETTLQHLEQVKKLVGDDDAIMKYAEKEGKGNVLWPLRYALSGQEKSPDPFTLMAALGKEESIKRIEKALAFLK